MADTERVLDLQLIKKRMMSGIVTLTLRTFFIQAVTFVATFALTVILEPSIFGVFFVVSAILNLFVYFSDVGLAAALIQKHQEPDNEDLKTTFTIQQILVFTLVGLGLIFSHKIANFYHLDHQGLWLLRILIFSLIISSLKTIPSIILERHLNFTKLVIPQIAENIVFYSVAVVLALKGFSLSSFTWAVLARGIVGLIIIYILSPWKPAFALKIDTAKKLTRFGVPFQANSILALIKDDLLTVFIGKILPYDQIGYIGWAQKFAFVPLRFFMDNVIKVTFPAYSRMQDNKKELASAIEKSIFFVCYLVYPSLFGLLALAPTLIAIIPRYQKWEPAIPLLYFFAANAMFAAVNTTLTNTLFAIGKPKIILNLMVVWTTLTWVLTYFLAMRLGYVGVGLASAIVAASTSVIIYFVKQHIPIKISRSVIGPLIASILMFVVVKSVGQIVPGDIFGLTLMVAAGVLTYALLSLKMLGKNLIEQFRLIIKLFLEKVD